MATDPSASGFLPISAFADGVGTPLSSSLSEFFDVFCLPRNADGKFVVKGASCHVERDPVIPSIFRGSFGFFFEGWKGCPPFRLDKGVL
ncbi:hypothetical protein SLEP1_g2424 [Rubroshorea leprosula]|uniref:Uncharacterized protein n=1 Tax=Rubroshorea leprosula TaxID=152421 RepID=A0AAV5HQV2_9ROSI|nr:hypothetical protein SLEP1_g2424 [Rubroshorea leprosula]